MLDVKEVAVKYGSIQALKNVSISVKKSEIVTVVGANGAGKSTLLKTIPGTVKRSSGSIKFEVDGQGILIDGTGDTNSVIASDDEADCTISLTAEVLEKLRDGDINPMMAVMGGQIKITGDMGLAMKVQSLMG